MAAFASVAELEAFMGGGLLGARGTAMLDYASAEIRGYCRQDISASVGRMEEFAGDATRQLIYLTESPVTAVTAITVDAVAFTDFIWSRWGSIHKSDWGVWDEGPIVVTYDSGYGPTEDEILTVKTICLEVASRALGGPQTGGFEAFGSEVAEVRGAAPGIFLTETERATLSEFMLVTVG